MGAVALGVGLLDSLDGWWHDNVPTSTTVLVLQVEFVLLVHPV